MESSSTSSSLPHALAEFVKRAREQFASMDVQVDAPKNPDGSWWLDFTGLLSGIAVVWQLKTGFGLYLPDSAEDFGGKPKEVYFSVELLLRRLAILSEHSRSAPSRRGMGLADLRELLGLSQADIAERLKVKQPSVSKLESRGEFKFSTLRHYVESFDGVVELRVKSRLFDIPLDLNGDSEEDPSPATRKYA